MASALFDLIENLSPWWWVAIGITLGALEMLTMSFFLIWPGVAAIIMAVLVWALPSMPGEVRLAVFAALSILTVVVGRHYFLPPSARPEPNGLNERSNVLIGRHARVVSFDNGEGKVEIDGIPWVAAWENGTTSAANDKVTITGTRGTVLLVTAPATA